MVGKAEALEREEADLPHTKITLQGSPWVFAQQQRSMEEVDGEEKLSV